MPLEYPYDEDATTDFDLWLEGEAPSDVCTYNVEVASSALIPFGIKSSLTNEPTFMK